MTSHTVQTKLNGRAISIETGKVAKQADGAVVVRCGGTMVLSTVVATKAPMEGRDFLPLTVEYREKAYAGGKIPGGFFKREGRPDEKETLTCRLIDRPIRPLFPKGFRNEIQVINLVISFAIPGISWGGHVGGLIGGILITLAYGHWRGGRAQRGRALCVCAGT